MGAYRFEKSYDPDWCATANDDFARPEACTDKRGGSCKGIALHAYVVMRVIDYVYYGVLATKLRSKPFIQSFNFVVEPIPFDVRAACDCQPNDDGVVLSTK